MLWREIRPTSTTYPRNRTIPKLPHAIIHRMRSRKSRRKKGENLRQIEYDKTNPAST
jgi:hypothetical protein